MQELSEFQMPPFVRGVGGPGVIDGMLSEEEGAFLAEHARGKVCLEMGAWCGLSTIVMGRVAKHVYSLDWHRGDKEMGSEYTLPQWVNTVNRYQGECCPVTLLCGKFADVLPLFQEKTFDLVYVDGAHDYASVNWDTAEAARLSRGTILWHDAERPEVWRAIQERLWLPEVRRGPGRMAVWARK